MLRRDTLLSRILRSLIPERIPWFAAPLYDRIARTAIDTYYKEVAESVVAHTCGGQVLDLGSGPGYLPIEIAKRASEVKVVGVDSSEALVRIAQKNKENARLSDRVRFVRCDANRLVFPDNSFDFVISTGSLHAWKNPVIVIDECFRVLKGGCEAWLLDPAPVMTPEAKRMLEGATTVTERLSRWWGSFTSKLTPPYTEEEMEEIIRRSKFEKADIAVGKWLTVKLKKASSSVGS